MGGCCGDALGPGGKLFFRVLDLDAGNGATTCSGGLGAIKVADGLAGEDIGFLGTFLEAVERVERCMSVRSRMRGNAHEGGELT